MIISIVGFGHIGSVVGVCLAEKGHRIIGIDKNKKLIDDFNNKKCPIKEKNLKKKNKFSY